MANLLDEIYNLPEKDRDRVEIVGAIPLNWQAWNAKLLAPRALYESGEVAFNTGLCLASHSVSPVCYKGVMVQSWEDRTSKELNEFDGTPTKPELLDIFREKKSPAFLDLDYVGWEDNPMTFAEGHDLVMHYLTKGYRGWINAYSKYSYQESSLAFEHAHVDINHAYGRLVLKFQNELEKNGKMGDLLIKVHELGLQDYHQ